MSASSIYSIAICLSGVCCNPILTCTHLIYAFLIIKDDMPVKLLINCVTAHIIQYTKVAFSYSTFEYK